MSRIRFDPSCAPQLRPEWISAAEGARFARKIEEMEKIRTVTGEEIEETIELLRKM